MMKKYSVLILVLLLYCCSYYSAEAQSVISPLSSKRVILKNTGDNIPFKKQVDVSQDGKVNTIYEIVYDFDLKGASVTIPDGSVLVFNGGSLRNGTIKCNDIVVTSPKQCFYNITGSLTTKSPLYALWFGETTKAIQKAIDVFPSSIIDINGTWTFDETVTVPYDVFLKCDKGTINATKPGTILSFYNGELPISLFGLTINLSGKYTGTAVEVRGAGYKQIKGWRTSSENATTGGDLYLPIVHGANTTFARKSGVVAHKLICGENKNGQDNYIYYKNIYSKAYCVHTQLSIIQNNHSGDFNDNHLYVESWFCLNGIREDTPVCNTNEFRLKFQCFKYSEKAIRVDNIAKTWNEKNGGLYYIGLEDPRTSDNIATLIDNCYMGRYYSLAGYSDTNVFASLANPLRERNLTYDLSIPNPAGTNEYSYITNGDRERFLYVLIRSDNASGNTLIKDFTNNEFLKKDYGRSVKYVFEVGITYPGNVAHYPFLSNLVFNDSTEEHIQWLRNGLVRINVTYLYSTWNPCFSYCLVEASDEKTGKCVSTNYRLQYDNSKKVVTNVTREEFHEYYRWNDSQKPFTEGDLDRLLSGLGKAIGITIKKTWDEKNHQWNFSFTPIK